MLPNLIPHLNTHTNWNQIEIYNYSRLDVAPNKKDLNKYDYHVVNIENNQSSYLLCNVADDFYMWIYLNDFLGMRLNIYTFSLLFLKIHYSRCWDIASGAQGLFFGLCSWSSLGSVHGTLWGWDLMFPRCKQSKRLNSVLLYWHCNLIFYIDIHCLFHRRHYFRHFMWIALTSSKTIW